MVCGPRVGSNDSTKNEIFQLRLRAPHGNDSGCNCATGRSTSRSAKNARERVPFRPAMRGIRIALCASPFAGALAAHADSKEWTVPAVLIFRGGSCLAQRKRGTVRDISGCCFVRRALSSSLFFPSFLCLVLPFCGNPIVTASLDLLPLDVSSARPLSRRE
jgi:hypothetical protein